MQFLEPVEQHTQFAMEDWPLHMTLADVFAINVNSSLLSELHEMLSRQKAFTIKVGDDLRFGSNDSPLVVAGIETNAKLQKLHNELVDFLEEHGAVFNSPEFTRDGFVPHSTVQKNSRINKGEILEVTALSLIDMFVDGDWRSRKVLDTISLPN